MAGQIKFAKLLEVDGIQVLFYTEPDPETDDCTKLHQIVNIDGVQADFAACGIPNAKAQNLPGICDEQTAERVIEILRGLLP